MKFKVFISLLLTGCFILFGFVLIIKKIIQQEEDRKELIGEFSSRNDNPLPHVPRTVEIPDEIRKRFAEVQDKPEIVAEFLHEESLQSVEFSPTNPNFIVSSTLQYISEKNIKLWDISNLQSPIAEFSGNSVSFSPDGKILAISDLGNIDGGVQLWDIKKGQFISTLRVPGFDSVFSPDKEHLAIKTLGIELWDVSNPSESIEAIKLKGKNFEEEHTFSADGKLMATIESGTDTVNIWEINENQVIKKNSIKVLDEKVGRIETMKFLPDQVNPILAIADNDEDIRLYYPPEWQNYNTIPAGNVYDFAFTPDGKTIISGGSNEIEFWSVENGKRIASIEGHSDWVKCVDVSVDGNFVVGCGNDGVIRVWNISDTFRNQQVTKHNVVVPIYFLPTNRLPQADIPEKVDSLLRNLQEFFADEMERHGYGRKSFKYEKNNNGSAKIYLFEGKTADDYYVNHTSSRMKSEIEEYFELTNNFYFIIIDESKEKKSNKKKYSTSDLDIIRNNIRDMELTLRNYLFSQQGGNIVVRTPLSGNSILPLAAKFGEEIGLNPDYRDASYIMSYSKESKQLSKSSAAWLDRSRLFNSYMTNFDNKTKIEKLSHLRGKVQYMIEDADGIYQVRMLVMQKKENPPPGFKKKIDPTQNQTEWKKYYKGKEYILHDALTLQGEKKTTVELDHPKFADNLIHLHVIDGYGNRVYMYMLLDDKRGISFSSFLRSILD